MNNDIPFLGGEGYVPSNEPNKSNFIWVIIAVIAILSFVFFICFQFTETSDKKIYKKLSGNSDASSDSENKITPSSPNPWITPDGKVFDIGKFYKDSQNPRSPPYHS